MASKFKKLMGIKHEGADGEGSSELTEEQKKKREEFFSRLDKDYEFARMTTHTQRGVGLGFSSQGIQPPSAWNVFVLRNCDYLLRLEKWKLNL